MNLIERYVWKNLLFSIIVAWLSLVMLDAFFSYINELGDADANSRYGASQALTYILYTLPRRLYEQFPYAVLIGSLMGLGNLAAHSEITAMRAAGIAINRIVIMTMKLGLVLALFVFAMGEWVTPRTEAHAHAYKVKMQQQQLALSADGAWLKNDDRILHIRKVWSKQKLDGLSIYEVDPEAGRLTRIIKAKYATYENNQWLLEQALERELLENSIHIQRHDTLIIPDLLPPNILEVATVTPEQLPAKDLAEFIKHQRDNSLSSARFELEFWKHFTTPLSTLVMLILAAPLVFGFQRNAGTGQRIFIGIMIGVTYLLTDRMISRSGLLYGLPPLLSALLPLLLFSAVGLFMLRRIR